ncbi:hypothetical protein IB286_14490 [Spongiibacter sp. KMU-158]|uniref:Uncharacterized protein n=1 Tax=Spongiibacter pelagi TaxID=2760804 RepID=A0A927GWX3_9GAMM|nr:hypothetical protein [Spongiibacter pelagi]MBD2860206.1 hypothetical protein [Spongiibacter pelagi]|tara:strand:+ start:311 stop:634 length:324 start_codon:yes stop_codon:yes gene_type:complete
MYQIATIEALKKSLEEGIPPEYIIHAIQESSKPIDYSKEALDTDFDEEERYIPPAQVLADLLESGFTIEIIQFAHYTFTLYWKDRGQRPQYAHQLFLKHCQITRDYS